MTPEMEKIILEAGLGDMLKTRLGRAGAITRDAALGALGSKKADGRLEIRKMAGKLSQEYNKFIGAQGLQQDQNSVAQFLKKYNINPQRTSDMSATSKDNNQSASSDNSQGTTTDNSQAAMDNRGQKTPQAKVSDPKLPQSKVSQTVNKYQTDVMKSIVSSIKSDNVNKGQVFSAVKELINHANDYGGNEKARVITFLKALKKNPVVLNKIPELSRMTIKEAKMAINIATYLVENNIRGKDTITETFNMLYENRPLSDSELENIWIALARTILMNRQENNYDNEDDYNDSPDNGNNAGRNSYGREEPNFKKSEKLKRHDYASGISRSTIDRSKLDKTLRSLGVDRYRDEINQIYNETNGNLEDFSKRISELGSGRLSKVLAAIIANMK